MAADFASRRISAVAAPAGIPPPPPLPPSKSSAAGAAPRNTSYFSRFVAQPLTAAYGSRPPSAQTNRPGGGRPNPLVPKFPGISSGSSQDSSHKTGLEISALDINRERTHAILAGREILKTIRVEDAKCAEETNLRAAIINYAAHNGTASAARHREALEIHDVKWSHGQFSTHIATAATNGKVILYDLNRAGMELARLHEHHRQVHKLAFNPHLGYLLLSASQDAMVRLWDLRDLRKEFMTCPSRDKFSGLSEGIRDVQWSPTDGVEFAFGSDNGMVQSWDYRYNKGPKLKLNAHESRTCTSIDWHPDGKHLLSASVDKTVRVWDVYSDNRRQKPAHVIRTPYPVYQARWRPPYWSDETHEKGVYQCTQMVTSYDRDHSPVHVWDFRRPYLPFREVNKYSSAPSDLLWHSRDLLWTVGREGMFTQTDVHFSPKVVDRRNLQAFAVSPSGEVSGVAQKRPRRRGQAGLEYSSATDDTYMEERQRTSPEKSSLRNSADDSVDDSFLSSSFRKHHGRTASNRSARSFSSTPPASETAPKVMLLTDSLAGQGQSFKPNQTAYRGPLPGSVNVAIFTYLAQKYKAIALPDPPTLQAFHDLPHVFEQNAQYAQRAGLYRLADTWRVMGVSLAVASRRRAELHREQRVEGRRSPALSNIKAQPVALDQPAPHDKQLRNPVVTRAILGATADKQQQQQQQQQQLQNTPESTSNLSTPLARPLTTVSRTAADSHLSHLPDPDHEEELSLPPAVAGPHASEKQASLTPAAAAQRRPTFNGPHWYSSNDLDERRAMIGSWRAPPRPPLSLEPTNAHGINITIPPRLDRHDSDESFTMFSASSGSQRNPSMPNSFASAKSHPHEQGMESIPEKSSYPSAESSFGNSRAVEASTVASLGKSVHISPTTIPIGKADQLQDPVAVEETGTGRNGSDHGADHPNRDQAIQDIKNLRRNNQLLRHDSSESEAFSRGDYSISSTGPSIDMEASGTIVPDTSEDRYPNLHRSAVALSHAVQSPLPILHSDAEEPIRVCDFQAMDVDAEQEASFAVIDLLNQILAFHADTLSDAQTSSLLILLLAPLLPQTHSPSKDEGEGVISAYSILATYADAFASVGFTPTQTQTVLSTQLSHLIATGIDPFQAECILLTYHSQLHSLSLFNAAASLRRLAYPTYPAVYEQALKGTQLGLLCLSCKKPINNPQDKMRCENCKRAQAPCPICWGRYPAFEPMSAKKRKSKTIQKAKRIHSSPHVGFIQEMEHEELGPSPSVPDVSTRRPTLWTWCPICGHGGHTNCLSAWFADPVFSEGACPTEGCLCDCVRGRRRDEKLREALGRHAEKEQKRTVRGDTFKVGESRAVGVVRSALGDREGSEGVAVAGAVTITRDPPGSGTGKRDGGDGKRVRVVVPDDER
ncbi:hypothetical protein GQ43DRAFT_378677 [Delitschia confertaspora ATCC 74209]|uniref:WD40 repeat-like protein n=1 Tax=Delitschia confertaspora ATCC 74209 TaxID=1513339 RepID=A0A9P4JFX4_9PLEO|nr:hypothetical protein GQ43DRAFT_378677 [Delitschia confertaspora ATCC 74209]